MFEIGIAAGELVLTEPAATIGTQRRWMHTLEHQIMLLVDHIGFAAGITAPEHIHQVLTMLRQRLNSGIGKLLPPQLRMTVGLMGTHRERSIEQQHALLSPTGEIARCGDRRTKVGLYLFKDILQRGRKLNAVLHRETQSMGLSWLVIGILTDNHHLYLVKRTEVEGIENQLAWRIAGILLILCTNRIGEPDKIVFVELTK